jgi:hypothetical protein
MKKEELKVLELKKKEKLKSNKFKKCVKKTRKLLKK